MNYDCNCNKNDWSNQYRMIDIDLELGINRQLFTQSFKHYSFDNPQGLLQYKGLPYPHILPESNESVGLTPLYYLQNLSKHYNCNFFLKNEGANPSGCFKDRETLLCLLNSQYNGFKKAVIYSSGNAAASAAYYIERTGRQLLTFVAGDTYPEKIDFIRSHGSDVVVIGDKETNFESGYRLFANMGAASLFANHNYDNWSVRNPFRVQGDKTIAVEIVKQLSEGKNAIKVPDYVIVPTANGSCLAGIWKGFKELKTAGIISRLPKMIPTGIKNANPVCKAVRLNNTQEPVQCNLSNVEANDSEVGSIIVAEEGYDSVEAARAVIDSGGFKIELHANDIRNALINLLEKEEQLVTKKLILPEPASLTSLAAMDQIKNKYSLTTNDNIVAIATGDGLKAKNKIQTLLSGKPDLQKKADRIIAQKTDPPTLPDTEKGRKMEVEANIDALTQAFLKLQKQNVTPVKG